MDAPMTRLFHEACVRLRRDRSLQKPHCGICSSLLHILPCEVVEAIDILYEVDTLASGWAKWSGRPGMPVPRVNGRGYARAAVDGAMWKGAYGALRLELLDHLISSTA